MKVKIKQGEEMIDATIEMVDGVMVVSPKEVKFEPKDGDVVVCDDGGIQIFICKESLGGSIYSYCMYDIGDNELTFHEDISYMIDRPATEDEKELLLDRLAEEGLAWDAERKKLVKLKWKPQDHEKVYVAGFTFYGDNPFCAFEDTAYSGSMQWRAVFERGWYFKTEQECQEFCNRLNEAIRQVKP